MSEQECAAACVAGRWDWYEWDPDGQCVYVDEEWTCESPEYKWQQPPKAAQPQDVYYGWNQFSEWCFGPVVADDWFCASPEPVTEIHWWGSFLGWKEAFPPYSVPHFHIQFWTDVPADPSQPEGFSHPGEVIHEVLCYSHTLEFAGWDFDPQAQEYESCFKFTQVLEPWQYFYQYPQPPGQVYWISIAACYD